MATKRKTLRGQKQRKKNRGVYGFIVTTLGVAIVILAIAILFRVQKIDVTGNNYCSSKEIRQMVQNDRFSVNSLYVYGKYFTGRGEVLPCIEKVKVTLRSPWDVNVKVKEKRIVGYLKSGEEYICFDETGLVLYKMTEAPENVPLVEGIAIKSSELYQQLESGSGSVFEQILSASRLLDKYNLPSEKILCKDDSIYIYMGNKCINLGNNVSADQIVQIPSILEKLGDQEGTLHLENYSVNQKSIPFEKGKNVGKTKEK